MKSSITFAEFCNQIRNELAEEDISVSDDYLLGFFEQGYGVEEAILEIAERNELNLKGETK